MAESDVSTQASCRLASAELEWISGVVTDSRRGVYGDDWSRMDLARSDSENPTAEVSRILVGVCA